MNCRSYGRSLWRGKVSSISLIKTILALLTFPSWSKSFTPSVSADAFIVILWFSNASELWPGPWPWVFGLGHGTLVLLNTIKILAYSVFVTSVVLSLTFVLASALHVCSQSRSWLYSFGLGLVFSLRILASFNITWFHICNVMWCDVMWRNVTTLRAGYKLSRLVLKAIARRYGGKDGKLAFNEFALALTKIVSLVGMSDQFFWAAWCISSVE